VVTEANVLKKHTSVILDNNTIPQNDIYICCLNGAWHMREFTWIIWTTVGQRQVAVNS